LSASEYAPPSGSAFPPVLDACCGGRMMWFNKADPRCLYVDKRRETHERQPTEHHGYEKVVIDPDHVADFTALPFPSDTFALVVFDPPHFARTGNPGYLAKMYGRLEGDWRDMLRRGFAECFRVLRPDGTLIFKWTDTETPVRDILALTPEKPLFGHRSGKQARTHWIAFLKPNKEITEQNRTTDQCPSVSISGSNPPASEPRP
jgi:SAM-dependent methyltransferase